MCQKILSNCEECGKDISKTRNVNFCSRVCYDNYREKEWRSRGKKCKGCEKIIEHRHVSNSTSFCSMSCRSYFYRKNRHINCSWCKVEFSPIKWRKSIKSNTYSIDKSQACCSKKCRSQVFKYDKARKSKISFAFSGSKHPNWSGGGKDRSYRGKDWRKIAEKCRDIAGRVCERCGKTEEENGRKLDVNHIIPFHQWSNKEKANHKSNLEALCKSCHTKADAKWKKENPVQFDLSGMFR